MSGLFPAPEPAQDSFDAFWQAYPRRVAKKAARTAWARLRPTPATLAKILAALDWQRHQPAWEKDGGSFIPYPATWLNQERWEDEPFDATPEPRSVRNAEQTSAYIRRLKGNAF